MTYIFLLFAVFLFAGCQTQQPENSQSSAAQVAPTARAGDSTMSGKVIQGNGSFALVDVSGKQTEIDSYKIDLSSYVGKQVSITGQFSGDTLFVAEVLVQ